MSTIRCLNCGKESDVFLCNECRTSDVLDSIFNDIRTYNQDTCPNPFLKEYASTFTEPYAEREIIPIILSQFDSEVTDYYYCRYYKMIKDDRFEDAALSYLQKHDFKSPRSQIVIYELIGSYIPNNFTKPQKWCEYIKTTDGLCCELYETAADYYNKVGDYDLAVEMIAKGRNRLKDAGSEALLIVSQDTIISRLNDHEKKNNLYQTKRPYWPSIEERRRAIAEIYDAKGIKHPRIERMPPKVPENEFEPIKEFDEEELNEQDLDTYCAFWCSEVSTRSPHKCIYQIGGVKIRNHKEIDSFESLIRPWDAGESGKKRAAKNIDVTYEDLEYADGVDIVLPKFFSFAGDDVLISTDALGNQAKLITRAARYAGMKEIQNSFYDILDFALNISFDSDCDTDTRKGLLKIFNIKEGKTALEKARVNKQLYDSLRNYSK